MHNNLSYIQITYMSHESTKLKQFELARFQFKFLHGTDGRDPVHFSFFFYYYLSPIHCPQCLLNIKKILLTYHINYGIICFC